MVHVGQGGARIPRMPMVLVFDAPFPGGANLTKTSYYSKSLTWVRLFPTVNLILVKVITWRD